MKVEIVAAIVSWIGILYLSSPDISQNKEETENSQVSNISIIFEIIQYACNFCDYISLIWLRKCIKYRYLFMDLFVCFWITLSCLDLYFFLKLPDKLKTASLIILFYRVITMMMGHLNILFLDSGKSTPDSGKIHSRIRYLATTALNYIELLIWSSVFTIWLQPVGHKPIEFVKSFTSVFHVLYYNFVTSITLGSSEQYPISTSTIAQTHTILLIVLSILIFAVIINIVINISKDQERYWDKEKMTTNYWDWRASRMNLVGWVHHSKLCDRIRLLVKNSKLFPFLDIGCGNGVMLKDDYDFGFYAIGIDISSAMLRQAKLIKLQRYSLVQAEGLHLPITDNSIGIVLLRMVLHNINDHPSDILSEVYRVLKKNGSVIIIEGVPPEDSCTHFFKSVLLRVHSRHFFQKEEISRLLCIQGFRSVKTERLILPQQSIRQWLTSAVKKESLKNKIYQKHLNMPPTCRRAYKARKKDDDLLIDFHFELTTGIK